MTEAAQKQERPAIPQDHWSTFTGDDMQAALHSMYDATEQKHPGFHQKITALLALKPTQVELASEHVAGADNYAVRITLEEGQTVTFDRRRLDGSIPDFADHESVENSSSFISWKGEQTDEVAAAMALLTGNASGWQKRGVALEGDENNPVKALRRAHFYQLAGVEVHPKEGKIAQVVTPTALKTLELGISERFNKLTGVNDNRPALGRGGSEQILEAA